MISSTLPARRMSMTPAQRVILLLGAPATIALVAWTGYSIVASTAQGSATTSYTEPITGTQLTMNVTNGNADIQGGAATGSARLTQTVSYGLVRPNLQPVLSVSRGASGTSIEFGCQNWNNCIANGTAGVPARTAVNVSTNGGNATVGGISSPVSVSTNGGSLAVSGITDGGTLSTEGGNVTANGVSGDTAIQTAGGSVYADQVTGDLDMSTQGGSIEGTALAVPDLTADASIPDNPGGNIDLTLASVPKDLQVVSGGGDVTIILPPGGASYDIRIDASSGNVSGTVSNTVQSDPSAKNVITVNSGGGDVTIS